MPPVNKNPPLSTPPWSLRRLLRLRTFLPGFFSWHGEFQDCRRCQITRLRSPLTPVDVREPGIACSSRLFFFASVFSSAYPAFPLSFPPCPSVGYFLMPRDNGFLLCTTPTEYSYASPHFAYFVRKGNGECQVLHCLLRQTLRDGRLVRREESTGRSNSPISLHFT